MKYQWNQPDSFVEELRFFSAKNGQVQEAVILLRPQDGSQVKSIDAQMVDQGLSVNYDMVDERPALRITGFKKIQDVVSILQSSGAVKGESLKSAGGQEVEVSTWQRMRANSLVLSAVFYQLGNISTALSGWFRQDAHELRTGLLFGVGDTTMLLFGKRSDTEKHNSVMQGFGEALKQNGFSPAFGSSFADNSYGKVSGWQKVRNFMHNKVIAVKSLSEISASSSFAIAGYQQKNNFKTAAGVLGASGFGLGLLIPEKQSSEIRDELGVTTPAEAKEVLASKPLFTRLKYKIQQMPLLISGTMAGLNNLSSIAGAFDERKHRWQKHDIVNRLGKASDGLTGITAMMNKSITSDAGKSSKVRNRKETAWSKANRLSYEYNNASESNRALLSGDMKQAHNELKTLQTEQHSVLEGRFGKEKLDPEKFWVLNLLQGGFFLVANFLYGISSKSGRSANEELLGKRFIASVATEVLMSPQDDRAEIINLAAEYAGGLQELDFTKAEISQQVSDKVKQLQKHPFIALKQEKTYAQVPNEALEKSPNFVDNLSKESAPSGVTLH